MANILINGLKAKTGGGKSILNNYLALLQKSNPTHRYFVLTPDKQGYDKYECESIRIVDIRSVFKSNVLFPLLYSVVLPQLLRSHKIDLVFNLGDIAMPSRIPQLYLFDWSYAVYPESAVWKRMDAKSYLSRRIKLFAFKRWIRHATLVIAQTETMKEKLAFFYGLRGIEVVPNAVSLENMSGGLPYNFNLPKDKKKLLYLTYYYPHKNLEVLIPLARKIKKLALPYVIVLTIDSCQHNKAKELLDTIAKESLGGVIMNVGPVSMNKVPSLYSQCDALLMPTLLESFSGTYVEAMFHKKTILTSNLDFATDVCGRTAYYFDPLDPDSILTVIQQVYEDEDERKLKLEEGQKQLERLLTWEQAFDKYQTIIEDVLARGA